MYTVVLMTALSGAADVPEFGRRGGGCNGCYGGNVPAGCFGGTGCQGSNGCYGSRVYTAPSYGCYGSRAPTYGCCGGGVYVAPAGVKPMPKGESLPPPKKQEEEVSRANLIIEVPADAKLFIDDQPTAPTSAVRTFVTPPLQAGFSYTFTLRAEITRDGQTLRLSREVVFRPGQQVRVSFAETDMVATASR